MELNAGRGPVLPQTPLSAFLLLLVPVVGQVVREEGGLGMLRVWTIPMAPGTTPSGCQCERRAPEAWLPLEHRWDVACCSRGVKPSSPHRGEREAKRKWRIHLLLTRCCLVTSAFCWLPLPLAPDGSVWLLKINHPPGRGVGERGEVEMVEEENVFAVPALQHHGDAGKGVLPQGGERAVTSSASMLDIILAFAPSCRLQLRDEQEVTSTWR